MENPTVLTQKEMAKIAAAIKARRAKKIALQIPEGLKTKVQELAVEIEKSTGVQVLILADPCFGACDVPSERAKELGCALVVHVGHADFGLKTSLPVVYVEKFSFSDPVKILRKPREWKKLRPYKKIGLLATVQHVHKIPDVKRFLSSKRKKAFVGKPSGRTKYPGQILGCDTNCARAIEKRVDAFLLIGTGRFHALGILAEVQKPVLQADPEYEMIVDVTLQKPFLEKRRQIKTAAFNTANKVGVLVSTKNGQMAKDAFRLKQRIERAGKAVWLLAMDRISPDKLAGMRFDCLVNAACPRIEEDLSFSTPIINASRIFKAKKTGKM